MASSSSIGRLAELVGGELHGDSSVTVRDVTHDSRQAGPGTLFVAVSGATHDGHQFVAEAARAGSPAVMVERHMPVGVPQIRVEDSRRAMAPAAAEVHGWPSRRLRLIGVTGTNGKTTVTHMVEAIAQASHLTAGLIGTVHTRVGLDAIPNTRTTPESPDFQRLLATMADAGASVVAAEVSSHALELSRIDAAHFAVAAFTNLSQDHLDFHGDMERYFEAKARLFEPARSERAVVFIDDPAGRRLADRLDIPLISVGESGDVSGFDIEPAVDASRFRIRTPLGEAAVRLPLGGRFNVDNALVAIGCAVAVGLGLDDIVRGLATFPGVPGRFELVSGDDPVRIIVDYAHTPAGISQAISTTRATGVGRVIAVFGAGGDRDTAKRPQMGAAASAADLVVVTSDNPRREDPEAIIDAIMAGIGDRPEVRRDADRRSAIDWAVDQAADGDAVLVLGRGHERGQELAGRYIPFDDRLVARDALARKRGRERR